MTFSVEDKRGELRARCSDQLRDRVDEFADEHERTNSEVIREAVREYLPDDDHVGPADPKLREVYLWLRKRSNDRNRVGGRAAINELSQTLSMKEQFVKSARLDPLKRDGWIRANAGVIEVVDRD